MNLIVNEMDNLIVKTGYLYKEIYPDKQLNELYNYWCLLDENEKDILELTNSTLDIILYSKYYWSLRFMDRFTNLGNFDAGLEQQQYKILEDMEHRLGNPNWEFVQMIVDNKV